MSKCISNVWNWAFGCEPPPPSPPRCSGIGARLLQERRERTDRKYTDRPADLWPSYSVDRAELKKARERAEEVDKLFQKHKREAPCQGESGVQKCELCNKYTCNACRFHDNYFIVSSDPLIFGSEAPSPRAVMIPDEQHKQLQNRLRDFEHPYQLALLVRYALRWHGYCNGCLPRVSATLVKSLDSRKDKPCQCTREKPALDSRHDWVCLECFERSCDDFEMDFNQKRCQAPRCQKRLWKLVVDEEPGFWPVCGWCSRLVERKALRGAEAALFEGREFEKRRLDLKRE